MATGIRFTSNIGYKGNKPLDDRQKFSTLAEMKTFPELGLTENLVCYVEETKKEYKWFKEETVDATTGKWREISTFLPADKQALDTLKTASATYATTAQVATAKQEAITAADTAADAKYVKKSEEKAVTVESQGLVHTIKHGGQIVGTINIPQDLFVKNFEYVPATKKLKITVSNADGSNPTVQEVSVAEFVQTYTNGTGLQLTGNQFSLTAEYQGLPAKVQTLEGKVTALEARENWQLGFTKTGNKYPVQHENKKLFVEVPVPEVPEISKVTPQADGLMSKEDKAKLDAINTRIFKVNNTDFETKERDNKLFQDAIYFIDERVPAGSTPYAFME